MTSTIIKRVYGPRSSCCNARIQCQKDYTDTHVYSVDEIETDDDGKIITARYSFDKTYDGIDGNNWAVTCSQCGEVIDTGDIEFEES